jgi:hypothetical protein
LAVAALLAVGVLPLAGVGLLLLVFSGPLGGGGSEDSAPAGPNEGFTAFYGRYIWPSSGQISSVFGPRVAPVAGASKYHEGVDVKNVVGTSIVAAARGIVTTAGSHWSCGNYVVIEHSASEETMYCHMSRILTSVGQTVSQGQVIGEVGSTGISSGPHLHYAVKVNSTWVNPAPGIAVSKLVSQGQVIANISLSVPAGGNPAENKMIAQQMMADSPWGWGDDAQWQCLETLWQGESQWRHTAANPDSSARGIPQAMMSLHFGGNWITNEAALDYLADPTTQIRWGLTYIQTTYQTPCGAQAFKRDNGWY